MKGLILSEQEVRAWLGGRKTFTRRLMKPQPTGHPWEYNPSHRLEYMMLLTNKGWYCKFWHQIAQNPLPDGEQWIRAPYQPGETVYIKETWTIHCCAGRETEQVHYKADGNSCPIDGEKLKWKSPHSMTEWAARSHALIVSVKPERIREITGEEVKKEGVVVRDFAGIGVLSLLGLTPKTYMEEVAIMEFQSLWESLHPGSWERNDFVFRIELKKQEGK